MSRHPLETYLRELQDIRSSGAAVKETSYYGALANLFNEIGKTLKPRVRCILTLKNQGAGLPDGGFFTTDQFQRVSETEPLRGQIPARGAIEVKSTSDEVRRIAHGDQVGRYLQRYRQVLVTNYRDFILVGHDSDGQLALLETYRLADSESAFWAATAQAQKLSAIHSDRFTDYLKRVMLHATPLAAPGDVAWFLASYARDAKARMEETDLPALDAIRTAMEEALSITFEGKKGSHFFLSTLVQTLFYGVFSAWVLWSKQHPPGNRKARFDWRTSAHYLRVPILRKLFYEAADPGQLDALNLSEVLDWAGAVLDRVDRAAFFAAFEEDHAVQYFYEPFLEAFDPVLRKELGVWYTPTEIVRYMVARVDAVLREELQLADGLADPRVYVLDPCCGTGAYLVEVLRHIATTLQEKGGDALLAHDLKRAAMERVFGFELLPAPFVVAHLQLGLLLQSLEVPLSDKRNERVGVYLTNALTGWEPPKGPKQQLLFRELEEERDAAEHVKRDVPILVILGNPPYNGFAGVAVNEERDLSNSYRTTKRAPAPQGQGLNDLYVRFFRMAERRIVEKTGMGVVCFISNYSWLDGLSFTGMREQYLEVFDSVWIDNLHGDRIISEYAPDGRTSETVFAIEGTSPGIKVGTAVSLFAAKKPNQSSRTCQIYYRDMDQTRAAERRAALIASLNDPHLKKSYTKLIPILELGLPLKPRALSSTYLSWPLLPEIFPVSFPGVKTSRDDVVVDIDRERLIQRMQQYFDPAISHEEMRRIASRVMEDAARFAAKSTRDYLRKRGFLSKNIVRYCYRPFDVRWLYWESETKLLDEKRAEYFPHVFEGNVWLSAGQRNRKEDFYQPQFTTLLADHHIVESNVGMFPLYLRPNRQAAPLFEPKDGKETKPNLSTEAGAYLSRLNGAEHDLYYHTIAILHSPTYRAENSGALRQDWPRVPLPDSQKVLLASAKLGRQVAELLDPENHVSGVTSGTMRPELKTIAIVSREGGGSLKLDAGDLDVTAGWGHAGKGGITMPGKGKVVERDYTAEERTAIGATGQSPLQSLGETTCDIYLNNTAYWKNIPARVWEYTIGGYQVIKKWLSYRERDLLGRSLTIDEAREVTNIARRIAAILLVEPELDANYQAVKQVLYAWQASAKA